MAFRESDSADQLNEKNKQIYKYMGSIREYNYSNLKELAVYNSNRIQFNNCIENIKDAQIKILNQIYKN